MPFDLSKLAPPSAVAKPVSTSHHGMTLTDDYGWLRADNWQDVMRDPSALPSEIRAYLEAENDYQDALLSETQPLQDALFDEMKGRVKQDDSSVPSPDGPYAYGTRYEEGAEYPLFTREPRDGGDETVLFHGPDEAKAFEYFALGHMAHAPDHSKMAWSVDTNGSEYHHLKVRDLASGLDGDEVIRDVGSLAWTAASDGFVYVEVDENHRPNKAYYKPLNGERTLIYEEMDPRFYVGVGKSLDGRWIFLATGQNDEDEVRLIPADNPLAPPVLIAARRPGHEYDVDVHGDTLFITTNKDGAENYKVMKAPIATPQEEHWEAFIPHRSDVLMDSVILFRDNMVRLERENALPRIIIRDMASGDEHAIAFDEEAYSLGIRSGYEFDTG
ncbi:MAG: S9 family peptidase, partial [Pseudomonadota bacterium]